MPGDRDDDEAVVDAVIASVQHVDPQVVEQVIATVEQVDPAVVDRVVAAIEADLPAFEQHEPRPSGHPRNPESRGENR